MAATRGEKKGSSITTQSKPLLCGHIHLWLFSRDVNGVTGNLRVSPNAILRLFEASAPKNNCLKVPNRIRVARMLTM